MSFTIGLLELFAYLLPGGLVLSTIVYLSNPPLIDRILSSTPLQMAFLVGSYIIGHLLTQISLVRYVNLTMVMHSAPLFQLVLTVKRNPISLAIVL